MSRIRYLGPNNDNARSGDIPRASGTIFDHSCALRMNGRLLDLPPQYLDAIGRTARLVASGYTRRNAESTRIKLVITQYDDLLHEPQLTC